jgi:hypothetical protein
MVDGQPLVCQGSHLVQVEVEAKGPLDLAAVAVLVVFTLMGIMILLME